jgi:hypothetical protein
MRSRKQYGVSFGPSYRPTAGDNIPANVRFVADYYSIKYTAEPANLIVCRHVLEHFAKPRGFIDTVRQAVGDRKDLVVYFEVPSGDFSLAATPGSRVIENRDKSGSCGRYWIAAPVGKAIPASSEGGHRYDDLEAHRISEIYSVITGGQGNLAAED